MTVGFRNASGTDLDDVFDPYIQGTKPAATGYRTSSGIDLNQRYAPLVYGDAAAATGLRISNGADLNTLFAKKGSAAYSLSINGSGYYSAALAKTNQPGSITASLTFSILSNGTFSVTGYNNGGGAGTTTYGSGSWLPDGESAANYEVQLSMVVTGTATQNNTAPSFVSCSTSRSCGISTSTAANTSITATGRATVTIRVRRIGGAENVTQISFTCDATGWK